MRISDWSSDVCSSDLIGLIAKGEEAVGDRSFDKKLALCAHGQQPGRAIDAAADTRGNRREILEQLRLAASIDDKLARQHRPDARRVGKEGVRTCRSRWSTYP